MKKLLRKSISTVLVLSMLFSLLSVSAFATTNINIKINDINNNVVNITASAEKEATVILASF